MKITILKKTVQKLNNKKFYGFDIETANNNKDFVLASIYSDNMQKFYYNKEDFIDDIKRDTRFRNSIIYATNLSFDFFGTFFNKDDAKHFFTLFRGSDLLLARTSFYKNNFHNKRRMNGSHLKTLTFIDSMNYAKLSVEKMGEIIGIPKIEKPSCLGKNPSDEVELEQLKNYNLRDSEITYKFMKFLINTFEELGATVKNTLASTAMSLFKNKYLDKDYILQDVPALLEQFESYYGGRTEAFKRGEFENYYYYDFNSLYPDVMRNEFPDTNSLRITKNNTLKYIINYHGVSKVDIEIPYMKYPLLPHRSEDGRVIFPYGKISGWYTHIELREAINLGCKITKVYKTHYFLKNCYPFKKYVESLYKLRRKYKEKGSAMEYVVKICMNSLYGKFGQRFLNKDNWVHESYFDISKLKPDDNFEIKGQYVRVIKDFSEPSSFCIPIWASYVTAYGRLKLHKSILEAEPIYVDTDSLITKKVIPTGSELGQLKLEMNINKGIVVRPKFYAVLDENNNNYVKIKGLGKRLSYFDFMGLLKVPYIEYDKFTKFKEALRRDLIPNELIKTHKEFNLNDQKRNWKNDFSLKFEDSEPIMIS